MEPIKLNSFELIELMFDFFLHIQDERHKKKNYTIENYKKNNNNWIKEAIKPAPRLCPPMTTRLSSPDKVQWG